MPIKKCTLPDGGSGYKYGDSGHCYKSREDALEQMRAIKWRQAQAEGKFDTLGYAVELEESLKVE